MSVFDFIRLDADEVFSVTSLSFWEFWTRPGKGEMRKRKGKVFDPNEVSVFIPPKEVTSSHTVLVSG